MAIDKIISPNIDDSDSGNFPHGRIRDNDGSGNGTPVNRQLYSDLHEFFARLMDLAAITYNNLPDSVANGYQLVDAARALAGKNDLITALNAADGNVTTTIKLSILLAGETLPCTATVDYASETHIKDTAGTINALLVPVAYKAGDYVRLIKTDAGVTLIRTADAGNLNVLVAELNYLKAASAAEEYAGVISNKSTTPNSNILAFARRVNGVDSDTYLATDVQNGLLSKDDKALLDSLVNPVKNVGTIAGIQPGSMTVGSPVPVTGNFSFAEVVHNQYTSTYSDCGIEITMANAMANTSYFVRSHIRSAGTVTLDDDIGCPVFQVVSTTKFRWYIQDLQNSTKNLTIYLEVVQA